MGVFWLASFSRPWELHDLIDAHRRLAKWIKIHGIEMDDFECQDVLSDLLAAVEVAKAFVLGKRPWGLPHLGSMT